MSLVSALQAGILDGGTRCRSQIFFAQPEPQFGVRLTDEFLTNRLKIFEADHPDKMLERLLACCWIPRKYVVPWLMRTKSRIPAWLVAEALEHHFPGLPKPMVAAAISINDGMGSPLDAAKILRELRASPHILARIFSSPHSELARQTCSLMNLEDEPFHMVVNGNFPLNYAIIVGRLASHDSQLQSDLITLLKENKPTDECVETIAREALENWAEVNSLKLKRKHSERTFENPYWSAGAVLSWIAYRDREQICQFESYRDWATAQMYKRGESTLKVDDPAAEIISALQDGRLGASKQRNQDLPIDLPPKFWAWKPLGYVFAINPIFERVEVLRLWKAVPAESAQVVETGAPRAAKKQMQARAARGRGRRPEVRTRIASAMVYDIESGKISKEELYDLKQEALAERYGAARETVVLAREKVLSEIPHGPNPDK
jgi:hypothetical protein